MGKGGDLNLSIPPTEVPLSGLDKFRNDLAANPLGAAGISYADMAGFSIPTMLAPDQMNAMQEQSPISSTIGQIGGAVTGTSMLGNFARNGLERLGPTIAQRLLGGGGRLSSDAMLLPIRHFQASTVRMRKARRLKTQHGARAVVSAANSQAG